MKRLFIGFVGVLCCLQTCLGANIGPQGFGAYLNKYFIETGTLGGNAVQKALDVGFQEVRSIEFDARIPILLKQV